MWERRCCGAAAALAILLAGGCSGTDSAVPSTSGVTPTVATVPAACPAATPALRVDLIDDAVAAVTAERGDAPDYFEINATEALVNLFVAGADGTTATPYLFAEGSLSSQAAMPGASGSTFLAEDLTIDPERVLSCVARELPDSTPTAFEVVGGPGGAIRYSVVVTSPQGGQLVVEVTGSGAVLSVDPV